jgi:hypothetical protein
MPHSRHLNLVLHHLEACGVHEEIVGDILEEMSAGRSTAWLYQQLLALCRQSLTRHVRQRVATPRGISCLLILLGLLTVSLVPFQRLIQVWLVVYYVFGMASLFAHMAAADAPPTKGQTELSQ